MVHKSRKRLARLLGRIQMSEVCILNVVEYVLQAQASFDELAFNEVDAAVLTQLCMLELEHISTDAQIEPPRNSSLARATRRLRGLLRVAQNMPNANAQRAFDAAADTLLAKGYYRLRDLWYAEYLDKMVASLIPKNLYELLGACAASPRYRDLLICCLEAETSDAVHLQYGAVSIVFLGTHPWTALCYRGTNTSLIGWRENFDMALNPPVLGQVKAAAYLNRMSKLIPADHQLYVLGHSKGGNLATYSAITNPELQQRVNMVYDLDGPGFKPQLFSADAFSAWKEKLCRLIPQASIVGMLMDTPVAAQVIEAHGPDISQHSPFTWEVHAEKDSAAFVRAEALSPQAAISHQVFSDWLESLDPEELPKIFDALFEALAAANITDASEVFAHASATEALQKLRMAARKASPETRDLLLGALSQLAQLFVVHGVGFAFKRHRNTNNPELTDKNDQSDEFH